MAGEQLVIAGERPVTATPDRCGHRFPNPTGAMVANHHISQLLISERVAAIHSAPGGRRRLSQAPRPSRLRAFALARRNPVKPISPTPS